MNEKQIMTGTVIILALIIVVVFAMRFTPNVQILEPSPFQETMMVQPEANMSVYPNTKPFVTAPMTSEEESSDVYQKQSETFQVPQSNYDSWSVDWEKNRI